MSGPADKMWLKLLLLAIAGGIALLVAWWIERKRKRNETAESAEGDE